MLNFEYFTIDTKAHGDKNRNLKKINHEGTKTQRKKLKIKN